MKYSKEERLKIGREIFNQELDIDQAAIKYGINRYTARDYYRTFKSTNIAKEKCGNCCSSLKKMTKDELITEIIKANAKIEKLTNELKALKNE